MTLARWIRMGTVLAASTLLLASSTVAGLARQVPADDDAIVACEVTVNLDLLEEAVAVDENDPGQYLGTPAVAMALDPTGIVQASEVAGTFRAKMAWIAPDDDLDVTATNVVSGVEASVKVSGRSSSTIDGWHAVTYSFPELGCWEIEGRSGDATVRATVLVVRTVPT